MEQLLIIFNANIQLFLLYLCQLIIVGATEFIAAVHLLYNVLSFYTCQTGQFFEFNEIIYYIYHYFLQDARAIDQLAVLEHQQLIFLYRSPINEEILDCLLPCVQ